ncbi:hypothetical protein K0U27_00810 [archaeon]|nr:hypothetical protein [archaeon]
MTKKTLIGVVSSHDSPEKNESLKKLFEELFTKPEHAKILEDFWFIFTEGTYERITNRKNESPLSIHALNKLNSQSTILPSFSQGGMTFLTFIVIRNQCKVLWSFQTSYTPHPLLPQNRMLMRICDQHGVKKLTNSRSVQYWIENYIKTNEELEQTEVPLRQIELKSGEIIKTTIRKSGKKGVMERINVDGHLKYKEPARKYLALVTDENNRQGLYNFVKEYESTLDSNYFKIFTNRTTLPITDNEAFLEEKIIECRGSKDGGFVEIAMEVLFGKCKEIIFIENPEVNDDPSNQIILGAASSKDDVLLFTKEIWARDWIKSIKKNLKNNETTKESIQITDTGFSINSNNMTLSPITFEYEGEKFTVTKNEDNKIKMELVDN